MRKYFGVVYNRKKGNCIKVLSENCGYAFMKMYALNNKNVRATQNMLIFDEYGTIMEHFEGKRNDFPNILKSDKGKHISEYGLHIEDFITIDGIKIN